MAVTKPRYSLADHVVVTISPTLIMLLVGSLCFFLINLFVHDAMAGNLHWVMFWYVLAIVLVTRIGIEQGKSYAFIYGAALGAVVYLYILRFFYQGVIPAIFLMAIVWWCAHKLTWDCTVVDDDDDDSSASGLMQTIGDSKKSPAPPPEPAPEPPKTTGLRKRAPVPHAPGVWVIYFSLAALPLFGLGQVLIPADDPALQHSSFLYLLIYVGAAAGLLLTTSFLKLRRYLRQRYLAMPPMITLGWVRHGISLAIFVLLAALVIPRPGVEEAWRTMNTTLNTQLHKASDYAFRFNPSGQGKGREGNQTKNEPGDKSKPEESQKTEPGQTPTPSPDGSKSSEPAPAPSPSPTTPGSSTNWLKILFLCGVALLAAWWVYRRWELIREILRSLYNAILDFFRNLFHREPTSAPVPVTQASAPVKSKFASFKNPFLAGANLSWTPEQIVAYSYEALQAWAQERGIEFHPERTAREFCAEIAAHHPELSGELRQLSRLYTYAAYRLAVPPESDMEPIKNLWRSWTAA